MATLSIPPDKAGYTVTDGEEVVRTQLDGGAGRYRRDIIGASSRVTVQWSVGPDGYEYLRAFYRVSVANGATPFSIMLLMGSASLTEHTAYFIPNTMRLSEVAGHRHVVTAELEVLNLAAEPGYDDAIIMLYEAYGEQGDVLLNRLDQLVNVDIPGVE